ncbi:bifunctional DNA primase/polymerase [Streptomyces sp. NBC_00210]|uniref:bifunctional DNA primase/polymerase n=1 Tax=Streptomyces sp. NBC_00210 TaxID=2903636 RepID=UPI0032454270
MLHNSTGGAAHGQGNGSAMIINQASVSILTRITPMAAAISCAAERGWRVIPARRGSKHPIPTAWQDRATTDVATIARWWTQRPDANVCIVTGQASNLWVLDIDDKNGAGGSTTLADLERRYGELPLTYAVGTGSGGVHYYWTWQGVDFDLGNSAGKLGPGLDTRGNGGQVVAPPSRADDPAHTMAYVVLDPRLPVAAPAWLLGLLRPAPRPVASPPSSGWPTGVAGILGWLARVQPGNQDPALCWAVRALKDDGLSPQDVGDQLRPVVFAWPCSREPWTERDIERHLRSAYRGVAG